MTDNRAKHLSSLEICSLIDLNGYLEEHQYIKHMGKIQILLQYSFASVFTAKSIILKAYSERLPQSTYINYTFREGQIYCTGGR